MRLGTPFFEELSSCVKALLFPFTAKHLQIVFRTPDEEDGAIGAALLATVGFLNDPEWFEKVCPPAFF